MARFFFLLKESSKFCKTSHNENVIPFAFHPFIFWVLEVLKLNCQKSSIVSSRERDFRISGFRMCFLVCCKYIFVLSASFVQQLKKNLLKSDSKIPISFLRLCYNTCYNSYSSLLLCLEEPQMSVVRG